MDTSQLCLRRPLQAPLCSRLGQGFLLVLFLMAFN